MQDLLIQAIGFIPSVITFTSLQSPNRKRILILQFICGFMWLTHYLLLGALTLGVSNIVTILRAVVCYYNDRKWAKSRWIPAGIMALYVLCAAVTWQGAASIFPIAAMMLTTVALWSHNMRLTRMLFLLNSPLMMIANVLTGSWACLIVEIAACISFALAVYRYDIRPKQATVMAQSEA